MIAPIALIMPAKSHAEVEVYAVAARDIGRAKKFARKHGIKKWYGGKGGYQGMFAEVWKYWLSLADSNNKDLLDDRDIDVVYNPVKTAHVVHTIRCTNSIILKLPNGLHYEWTMKALAAGKHVLLEKPSGDVAEETRRMFEFANQKGLVLLEAFHYRSVVKIYVTCQSCQLPRFHPAIQRVKEIIDSGELGMVKEIHATLCFPKGIIPDDNIRMIYDIGGGALMDCGCKYR